MSNIQLFQSGAQLPAHLKRGELSEVTKSLMGGGSFKRISIEGGVYRMIVGGQEVAVNEDRAMNIIILRAADHNSRTYYEGVYTKGVKSKPACYSDDSKVPHPSITNPQNRTCAGCPQDVKGSGVRDNTRACRYQRRLAVLLENDTQGDIYAMSIPAASLFAQGEGTKMGLQQYARFLGGHGIDVNAVVTELRFDTQAEGVKVNFSAVRPLTEEEFETVLSRRNDPAAIDSVTMTVAQLDEPAGAAAQDAPKETPAPVQQATAKPVTKPVEQPVQAAPAAVVAQPKATPKPKSGGFVVAKKEEPVAEPVVRETAKPVAVVEDVNAVLSDWGDADD